MSPRRVFIARAPERAVDPFELICPYCGWEGTQATFDAHMNAFCPECERPVQLKRLYDRRK